MRRIVSSPNTLREKSNSALLIQCRTTSICLPKFCTLFMFCFSQNTSSASSVPNFLFNVILYKKKDDIFRNIINMEIRQGSEGSFFVYELQGPKQRVSVVGCWLHLHEESGGLESSHWHRSKVGTIFKRNHLIAYPLGLRKSHLWWEDQFNRVTEHAYQSYFLRKGEGERMVFVKWLCLKNRDRAKKNSPFQLAGHP